MKPLNSQKIQIKLRSKFLKAGVKMLGPETIFFSKDTKIGKNVSIEPYVVFGPKVKIGNNVIIKSFSHLESCKIESKVEIGPYARIRPETILKEGSRGGKPPDLNGTGCFRQHDKTIHRGRRGRVFVFLALAGRLSREALACPQHADGR